MIRKKVCFYILPFMAVASIVIPSNWILFRRIKYQKTSHFNGTLRNVVATLSHAFTNSTFKSDAVFKRNLSHHGRPVSLLKAKRLWTGPVYLFGAAAGNSTNTSLWDIIRVYGVYDITNFRLSEQNFTCCLQFRTQTGLKAVRTNIKNKWIFWAKSRLRVFHITCKNLQLAHQIPETVIISPSSLVCDNNSFSCVKIRKPLKEPGNKLAIGSQIAYGNISADHIIDWMETYRHLGVDKVVAYYYKLTNNEALKVLLYYHDNGFLDLYRYEPAGEDVFPRDFKQKGNQLFNDLQAVVKDSFEKMSGYQYFGIIDLDEYLIPSKNRTLKEMLSGLHKTYTDAAGFVFQSQYFYTSWGKSGNFNDLIFGEYVDRTTDGPWIDNPKQIYMPQRISYGNIHTHRFEPLPGFKRIVVPAKEGFIRHYRQFRRRSNVTHMMNNVRRVRDTTLAHWSEKIKDKVHAVRKKLESL